MNSKVFYLNDDKTDYITAQWEDNWSKTQIYRNNKKIGDVESKSDLEFGKPLQSGDNRILFLQLKKTLFGQPYLELLVDGTPHDFKEPTLGDKIYDIYISTLIISGINIVAGLISISFNFPSIDKLGFGPFSIAYGVILLSLGRIYRIKKSILALVLISTFILMELVVYIYLNYKNHRSFNFDAIAARFLLIVYFSKGIQYTIKERKEHLIAKAD